MAFAERASGPWLACASFLPEAANVVELLAVDLGSASPRSSPRVRLPHFYPATGARWVEPPGEAPSLATSGDSVRLWSAAGELRQLMRHDSNPNRVCTPISALDVAALDLVSCDVYGLCACWDIERGAMRRALDLGQPLCDVAFGPEHLLAAVGTRGDCFLVDSRSPQAVDVLTPAEPVSGPARITWGKRSDTFAVAWQGGRGGIVLYSGRLGRQVPPVRTPMGHCADLQWSSALQVLCCASDSGVVEAWRVDGTIVEPCFTWEPGEACTAIALSPEVQGRHAVAVATCSGLWLAALPQGEGPRTSGGRPE